MQQMSFHGPEWMHGEWLPLGHSPDRTGEGRIAIIGQSNAGKKTLCNSLWGWEALSDEEYDAELIRNFGLFYLINLPENDFDLENILFRLVGVELVIYVLNAEVGITRQDFNCIARLRAMSLTMIVILNRADTLPSDQLSDLRDEIASRIARPVMPINASDQAAIQNHFLPIVIDLCPSMAVPLAAEVTSLRHKVALRLIQEAAMSASFKRDSVVRSQLNLIKDIASLYGVNLSAEQINNQRVAQILELFHENFPHYLNDEARKWRVDTFIASFSTWLVGRLALAYFEANVPGVLQWMTRKQPNVPIQSQAD